MSIVQEYRDTQAQIAALEARMSDLAKNDQLQHEIEFEEKMRALMAEYGVPLTTVIAILSPVSSGLNQYANLPPRKDQRRARVLVRYKNPETGEVIDTKGGPNKALKNWKDQYGADVVAQWTVPLS